MIPDNVEKIIMTKEDYDRNVEQLLVDKCKAELEIERLNNIINEVREFIEEWKYKDGDGRVYFDINTNPDDLLRILDKGE